MTKLNQNMVDILNILNDGEYHDGTQMGDQLNISRAAVWKIIKKLEQYQIAIDSLKGKGYKLLAPLKLLDANAITAQLRHTSLNLTILEKTDSTNHHIKNQHYSDRDIVACLAEMQTAGKGRMQRTWHSPFAENIYLSIRLPFEKDISELSGLSLVAALSVCHAIEKTLDLKPNSLSIKWPNDILVNGKKLGGILTELIAESNGLSQVIIGIGINVNMTKALKKHINQQWISLNQIIHQCIDRNPIAAAVIDTMIDDMERFTQHGFAKFMPAWKKRDYLANSPITICTKKEKATGICLGINALGHIKLQQHDGQLVLHSYGDASIMK